MPIFAAYELTNTPLLRIEGKVLIDQHDAIAGFLETHFKEKIHSQFAEYKLTERQIQFSTPLKEKLTSWETLAPDAQQECLELLVHDALMIEDFFKEKKANNLESLEIWQEWMHALFHPAHCVLFKQGSNLILAWGCDFSQQNEAFISAFIAEKNRQQALNIAEEETLEEKSVNSDSNSPASIIASENGDDKKDRQSILFVGSQKKPARTFFGYVRDGLIALIRWGWWFLILLALLAYWLYTQPCRSCSVGIGEEQARENALRYLPPQQGIRIPINPDDIGYGEDSLFLIAEDRVNIALKRNQSNFYQFIDALGENFLNESRKIIYYSEETSRIQLEYDPSAEPYIKDSIRKAVPEYELLIWDESIFQAVVSGYNDPMLRNPEESWHLDALGMQAAWAKTQGSEDITVAVIDDGFDLTHPELQNSKRRNPYNVLRTNDDVYGTPGNEHGTHVASLILATPNNGEGLIGIAPNVTFMPIQIGEEGLGYLSFTDIIDGILYAIKNKADVINMSLGKVYSPIISTLPIQEQQALIREFGLDEEEFWHELFEMADAQNTTIVIAAGNEQILTGIDPMQRHSSTIIVGAVDSDFRQASFSNFGPMNTVYAPGVQVYSAVPNNSYEPMDGTSMAAPIVTGSIALYKSLHPGSNNATIKSKLIESLGSNKVLQVDRFLSN